MKNWGHDFLKAESPSGGDEEDDIAPKNAEETEEGVSGQERDEEPRGSEGGVDGDMDRHKKEGHAGTKRKPAREEKGPSKKRETCKGSDAGEPGDGDIAKGDTVSWKWGGGYPQGKVLGVKEET